jgi:Polyketide cyclase / dehydrase and lipid transport
MDVDVLTDIEIERPRFEVADYVSDPDNATAWYENIKKVEWKSPKALKEGAKVAFEARFLGRTMAYTYEVKKYIPGQSLVMGTAAGPFPMETSYTFSDTPSGATKVELRNRGRPSGFGTIIGPAMASAMKRANRRDLARLKSILEGERS